MKRLLTILLIALCSSTFGQQIITQDVEYTNRWSAANILNIPFQGAVPSTRLNPGSLRFYPSPGKLAYWNTTWQYLLSETNAAATYYNRTQVDALIAGIPLFDASQYYTKTASDARFYPLSTNPAGYLTSFTEVDPTVPTYAKSLTAFSVIKTSTDALYPTQTGGNASGTWNINVLGNASTVTNGVYSTGSYANPPWITSLAYSKLTGVPNFTLSGITANGNITGDIIQITGVNSPSTLTKGLTLAYDNDNNNAIINSYDFTNSVAKKLILNPSQGFVGIGTTTPSDQLDVNGTIKALNWSGNNTNGNFDVNYNTANTGGIYFYGGTTAVKFGVTNAGVGTFTGDLTASSLIKSGGTSSQFLKADGSVDATAYAPSSSLSSYELLANKQNSLTTDGTGVKYPTVDAVNTIGNGLIHTTGNETKNGRLSLITSDGASGTSPTASVAPLSVSGGRGGTNTKATGTVQGVNAPEITIKGGAGGDVDSNTSGFATSGDGANIDITAGDGGNITNNTLGTKLYGFAGSVMLQGGNSWSTGTSGSTQLKGGSNYTSGGGRGGNVYLVSGFGNNNNEDNPLYNGTIFLNVSDVGLVRGNTVIGSDTDDYENRLQVTGNSKLTGDLNVTGDVAATTFIGDLTATTATVSTAPSGSTDVVRLTDLSSYELLSNKSTSTSLGTSNTLYPTQNAVKTYVDGLTGNYVTTNTNQTTGLTGNKVWSGQHEFTQFISLLDQPTNGSDGTHAGFSYSAAGFTFNPSNQAVNGTPFRLKSGNTGLTVQYITPATSGTLALTNQFAAGSGSVSIAGFTTNITTSAALEETWIRVTDVTTNVSVVTVTGCMFVTPTATGYIEIAINPPVATLFTNDDNMHGTVSSLNISNGAVSASTLNDNVRISGTATTSGSSITLGYSYSYKIR